MNSICRICMGAKNLSSIFAFQNEIAISTKIMSFASVQIHTEDNLPSAICAPCARSVSESYELKIKCETSDIKLRRKLNVELGTYFEVDLKGEDLQPCEKVIKNEDSYINFSPKGETDNIEQDIKNFIQSNTLAITVSTKGKHKTRKKAVPKKKPEKKSKVKTKENQFDNGVASNNFVAGSEVCDNGNGQQISADIKLENELNVSENTSVIKDKNKKVRRASKPQKEQCFTCGRVMSSRFRLKMHMRTHTGERPYSCQYCPKRFALAQNAKVHERVHTGLKPLRCATCGKCFAQSAGLVAHVRLHTGETPYKCTLCVKSFRTPGHLQYHVRQHTGEKNFECGTCGRAFITRGDLTAHARTHSGERRHVCAACGARLARASHLARHMATHSGLKPYACGRCDAAYVQKGDLARHEKKHLGAVLVG